MKNNKREKGEIRTFGIWNKSFIVNELLKVFGKKLTSIVLFGSHTRKNYDENSDIDLIIIADSFNEHNLAKLRKSYLLSFKKKLDIHIFSKKEAKENFRIFSPMFVTLLLGKRILFDKEMFFKNELENFAENIRRENIKYCEGGKIWEMKKVAENL